MKTRIIIAIATVTLALCGQLMNPSDSPAQSNAQYSSTPPFISNVVTPNILILMDNSGSMAGPACDSTWCGTHADGTTTPVNQSFVADSLYSGLFDPLSCYTYNATSTRFDVAATKSPATVNAACGSTEWDGNLLNWATFRRFDAVKKAMSGGDCVVTRNADGTCPASGSPSMITIKAQTVFDSSGDGHFTTASIPNSGSNRYVGRIPVTTAQGGTGSNPANLWIHLRGGTNGMGGTICVDNDSTEPGSTATSCNDGDGFSESQRTLRLSVSSEPTGVIQQIGGKARFGLLEFKGAGNGGRMLTGIGSRQSIDFSGSTVETFNTNTAAMLDAIGESFPSTWTPLSESLYDAIRYVAQVNSAFAPQNTSYVYPIAFSGGSSNGVAFQGNGIGSVGSNEISALTGSETCPAGYIASACGRDPYFYGSNHSPAWSNPSKLVTCCKTFIMIFTDGEPTQDQGVPSSLQDQPGLPAHAGGVPSAIHGLHCTGGSGTIHNPNGTCNTNSATPATILIGNPGVATQPGEHKTDYASSGSHYLDDVAYWGHTTDLRQGTVPVINVAGHDLPGMQNVTVYSFFAFGNMAGREVLMQTAKQGSFDDTNGNNIPDQAAEYDKENNATGAPTPDGVPDAYFESSNVDDLQDKMLATISSILRKSSSGTSVSVLATSSNGEGALYQSYFYPSTIELATNNDVKWTGYTHGLFVDTFGNTREDTDGDGRLNYKTDKIVITRYDSAAGQTKVDKYLDSDGDGKADLTLDTNGDGTPDKAVCVDCDKQLSDIRPIWEAGKQLALRDASTRKILTWVDTDNNGLVGSGEQIEFKASSPDNSAVLAPYLRAGASPYTSANIVNFIRGEQVTGLRDRQLTVSGSLKVWKLGDIIHSTATIVPAPKERYDVIYGDSSYTDFFLKYRNRRHVAYVGANDGMLHAFNAGFYNRGDDASTSGVTEHGWFSTQQVSPPLVSNTPGLGEELWGFVPYQVLPQLQWLASTNYQHVYYVDLKPKATDVRIFTPDTDHPNGWGTVLIVGLRMGGSCGNCSPTAGAPPLSVTANFGSGVQTRFFYSAYFVLDVTNPEVDPKLLWVFSDAGQGLTTSYPSVTRVSPSSDGKTDNTNAKWFVLFGSGPTSYEIKDNVTGLAQSANIYAVDLKTGPGAANGQVTTMPSGSWNSFMGDLVGVDKDIDYRGDVAYVGRVIHDGVLPWRGKMYRLTMGTCSSAPCTTSTWGVASGANRVPTEMIDTFNGSTEVGPITAAPTVTLDDNNKMWVFFGTGRYYGGDDKTNTETQYFFGLKDSVMNQTCSQTSVTSCMEDDLVDVSSAQVCTICSGNQVTGVPGVTDLLGTSTTSLQGKVQSKEGWFTRLSITGERVVVSPTLIGGVVLFTSFVPVNDICKSSGDGYLYSLFYLTGSAPKDPVVGTTTSGGNTNVNKSISLGTGSGVASQVAVHLGSQGSGGGGTAGAGGGCQKGMTGFIQSSTGTLNSYCTNAGGARSRYISWINLRS